MKCMRCGGSGPLAADRRGYRRCAKCQRDAEMNLVRSQAAVDRVWADLRESYGAVQRLAFAALNAEPTAENELVYRCLMLISSELYLRGASGAVGPLGLVE